MLMMIEAAINENSTKMQNPSVPYSVDEVVSDAVACAAAGASIIHFHARSPKTGKQMWTNTSFYREAFELIREETDAILYPSQLPGGLAHCPHLIHLAQTSGLELATVDIFTPEFGNEDSAIEVIREMIDRNVVITVGIRELGHIRRLSYYKDLGLLPPNVYLKLFLGPHQGPTPDARGLLSYLDAAPRGQEDGWWVNTIHSDSDGRIHQQTMLLAAAMGGHIRTGLGDCPQLGTPPRPTNRELVEMAVEVTGLAGRTVATPTESRRLLGIPPSERRPREVPIQAASSKTRKASK